jgi:hypothetical protein
MGLGTSDIEMMRQATGVISLRPPADMQVTIEMFGFYTFAKV